MPRFANDRKPEGIPARRTTLLADWSRSSPIEQVQPWGERARTTRERLSSESIAVGTVMLALNSILVGKPPSDHYIEQLREDRGKKGDESDGPPCDLTAPRSHGIVHRFAGLTSRGVYSAINASIAPPPKARR